MTSFYLATVAYAENFHGVGFIQCHMVATNVYWDELRDVSELKIFLNAFGCH